MNTLLPFALERSSNELVDVGQVPRGNDCDCICPSCGTPLVAKQGAIKEWHFAHRSRGVHSETKEECKYSFVVSVRLMIRQLAEEGVRIYLPEKHGDLSEYSPKSLVNHSIAYKVTDESFKLLQKVDVGVEFSGVSVDVYSEVEGFPLIIYVTYKGRLIPSALAQPDEKRCGVLQLSLEGLRDLFEQGRQGNYTYLLKKFLEENSLGRKWIYHPREQMLRDRAMREMEAWSRSQKTIAAVHSTPNIRLHREMASLIPKISDRNNTVDKKFRCLMCNAKWVGVSFDCRNCQTHLYTRDVSQGEQ